MYMNDNMYVCLCIYIDRKCLISIWPLRSLRNNEETHCQYIYLFIYLFIYFMLAFTIKSIKTVIYTFHYIQLAIQMVFNKQICMLVYVNQNNREK